MRDLGMPFGTLLSSSPVLTIFLLAPTVVALGHVS
jgi:hypothetical protein